MLLAEAGCVFMGLILYLSGVHGRVNSICALKGSSVDLPCSAQRPTTTMKWYTVDRNGSTFVQKELSADENHVMYNMSAESNFTLTIKDLRQSDTNVYCCRETTDNPELCRHHKTELHVADLQVKVIPATEGQTVTLMCSTSCPLTENPAVYIWYKNREFLYQDWSPWYQQLVSSEKAVRYSCAIKGYDDLRAPQVAVDSVTSTCFSVTYAEGRMCSYKTTSVDEPCSITYPRDVHFQMTKLKDYDILTCTTSCPMADRQTAYRWYWNRQLYDHCESQDMTVISPSFETISCAVKGHEDLRSDENCLDNRNCESVNYVRRRICALEGSSVNISSEYSHHSWSIVNHFWNKGKQGDEQDAENLTEDAGRVEFHDMKNYTILTINNLKKNDSAEYKFTLQRDNKEWKQSASPGVTLVVTGLKVTMTPSAVVTEGQRVTLSCSTSCPLTDNTNYIWYFNSRPLTPTEKQNKHLVLDPVRSQHAGNYSCAVETPHNISSSEENLTVKPQIAVAILNAVKLTLILPPAVFLLYLRMRKKRTLTSAAEQSDKVQTGKMDELYEPMHPAERTDPAEQQEDTV
ncbi:B-cell receptor CD22-like isoform X2 [Sander lucioperca]|uniref:B-cell receptor CD22-like isoform X2 n=1 Tax=Sander lucioperca TaxID=283035 RepID=UPI00125E2645|nr:B-cell receptor CD22-like isoform X2 [Sander lucioperca]